MRIPPLALAAFLVLPLALSACERKEEAAPAPPVAVAPTPPAAPAVPVAPPTVTGFNHSGTLDAAGYYIPRNEIRVGTFKLNHLGVGAASDFTQWEQGDRASVFGPVLMQFDDVTSPVQTNELGGEAHTVSVRVLPSAYSVDGKTLRFVGQDSKLGRIAFEGAFQTAALAQARAEGSGPQAVLTGTLQVGTTRISNASFTFFAGD
ncbi:MAG: hypothetical protein QE280_14455 [Caulobacter sp.]|nr:hypothetical protein [Caulobacter sp.]